MKKSKVEQGERILPPEFYTPVSKERARLALDRYLNLQFNKAGERPRASIPANPDDDDLVLSRFVEQAAASLPESQPAPEMDYQQEALSLQDAIDNIVPCTDQEVAAIADWLRAHDARVQPSGVAGTERLREALSKIQTIAQNAPELNMANYNEDQVSELNQSMIDVYRTAESALKESSPNEQRSV